MPEVRGRLGRFELVSHLASGGMAKVYLAKVDGLAGFERFVVLKTLAAADIPDESYVGMFLDEARLAASLHHQNIAQVYEVGVTDDTYFLAMEYVHGKTLRALLEAMDARGRRLPLDFSLSVIAAAAAGLHHAHDARSSDGAQLSIVHRDVSPSNVLVSYDGTTKLIDFGIAKAEARQTHTKTGFVKGKAGYMAPEQARGYDVDRRSDIFALGILAYELTTQHRAFDAPTEFERVEKIVHGDLTPPSRIVNDFPHDLEATLLTALSLDPDERFQTADEFRLAIEQTARNHNITLGTAPVVKLLASLFGAPQAPWVSVPHQPETAQVRRMARGSMRLPAFLDSIPSSVKDEDSDSITTPHDLQEPDDIEFEIIAGRATPPPRLTPALRDRQHPRAGTIRPVVAEDKPTVVAAPTPELLATTDEQLDFQPTKAAARTSSRSSEQRAIAAKYADVERASDPRRSTEYSMTKRSSPAPMRTHNADHVSLSSRLDVVAHAARAGSSSAVPVPAIPAPRSVPERPVRFARSSSAPPNAAPTLPSTANSFVPTPVGETKQFAAEPVVAARLRIHPLAVVVGVGLLVGLGVGLTLVMMTEKKTAPAPEQLTPAVAPSRTPVPHASNVKIPASSSVTFSSIGGSVASHAPAAATTPSPDTITLTVTSTPKGATVVLDGERLGRTPFTTKIPRESKASWLKVRMTEHSAQRIQVQRASDITWNVSLEKIETDEASEN